MNRYMALGMETNPSQRTLYYLGTQVQAALSERDLKLRKRYPDYDHVIISLWGESLDIRLTFGRPYNAVVDSGALYGELETKLSVETYDDYIGVKSGAKNLVGRFSQTELSELDYKPLEWLLNEVDWLIMRTQETIVQFCLGMIPESLPANHWRRKPDGRNVRARAGLPQFIRNTADQ